MISSASVPTLIESLRRGPQPDGDLLDGLRLEPGLVGNCADPAENWGGWGFLPIGAFENGDLVALQPRRAGGLNRWPVVRLGAGELGGGPVGHYLASSLSGMVASLLLEYEANNLSLRESGLYEVLLFAKYLGDTDERARHVGEAIVRAKVPEDPLERLRLAEGKEAVLFRFEELCRRETEPEVRVRALRTFLAGELHFADAHYELFDELLETDADAATPVAWDALQADLQFGGSSRGARTLARHVVERWEEGRAADPRWSAVLAMAEGQPCGLQWFESAQVLERADRFFEAYAAYRAAAYWIRAETDEAPRATRQGGRRCAQRMGDCNLRMLFADMPDEELAFRESDANATSDLSWERARVQYDRRSRRRAEVQALAGF